MLNGQMRVPKKNPSYLENRVVKGQIILRWFLRSSISSKKRTKQFVFTSMRIVFVRFLEEIDDLKKPFRN